MKAFYSFFYYLIWPFFNLLHPIRAIGRENIPEGAALICPNHTQTCDPFMIAFAVKLKNRLRVMAKAELMDLPVLGWMMKTAGVFGVERGKSDVGAIKQAMKCLRDGEKLLLFPEGTRSRDGTLGKAKGGAAMLSIRTGAPIVPVYMPPKKRWFRPTPVVFGAPYIPQVQTRRGSAEEYEAAAEDLMARIADLERLAV